MRMRRTKIQQRKSNICMITFSSTQSNGFSQHKLAKFILESLAQYWRQQMSTFVKFLSCWLGFLCLLLKQWPPCDFFLFCSLRYWASREQTKTRPLPEGGTWKCNYRTNSQNRASVLESPCFQYLLLCCLILRHVRRPHGGDNNEFHRGNCTRL